MKIKCGERYNIRCNHCGNNIRVANNNDIKGQVDLCSDFCRRIYKKTRRPYVK